MLGALHRTTFKDPAEVILRELPPLFLFHSGDACPCLKVILSRETRLLIMWTRRNATITAIDTFRKGKRLQVCREITTILYREVGQATTGI